MFKENLKAVGEVSIVLRDEHGRVKDERKINNLVVTGGLGYITSRMKDATTGVMSHLGVGTTNTAPATAQTALLGEIGTRVSGTVTQVTTTTTNDTYQIVGSFAAGNGTGALVEAGIFNASTTGLMLSRVVFAVINKGANDSLDITWKIQLTAV